jgi:hypothetical protein
MQRINRVPSLNQTVIPAKAGIKKGRWIPGQARNDGQKKESIRGGYPFACEGEFTSNQDHH